MAFPFEFALTIANFIVSLGGLAGVIVWTSQKDNYRDILDDGYGLYWFTCIVSALWGLLSIIVYVRKTTLFDVLEEDKMLTYAAIFFTGLWTAATAKVSNYLNYCIRDLIDSNDDNFLCNGEIITTAFGAAAVMVWVFTFVHYFFRAFSEKNIEESNVEMNADSSVAP